MLRDLIQLQEDHPEVHELIEKRSQDPLVTELAKQQAFDGSWSKISLNHTGYGGPLYSTAMALYRLGYLGLSQESDLVMTGANFLFSKQKPDGSWPLIIDADESEPGEGYSMIPLQTAFPLRGLAACGFGQDARCEKSYDWLVSHQLDDGSWPTGIASGNYGYVGGYRRMAHSRWGCRSNTTAAVSCLSLHPIRRSSEAARKGLDMLLGRETRETRQVGYEVARLLGAEPIRGFISHFARFDPGLILSLCWKINISTDDPRVRNLVEFITDLRGPYGLWEYSPHPHISRWISFDLLRSLNHLDDGKGWIGFEPQTPFTPYLKQKRRF